MFCVFFPTWALAKTFFYGVYEFPSPKNTPKCDKTKNRGETDIGFFTTTNVFVALSDSPPRNAPKREKNHTK
jgi:hypothetical protein